MEVKLYYYYYYYYYYYNIFIINLIYQSYDIEYNSDDNVELGNTSDNDGIRHGQEISNRKKKTSFTNSHENSSSNKKLKGGENSKAVNIGSKKNLPINESTPLEDVIALNEVLKELINVFKSNSNNNNNSSSSNILNPTQNNENLMLKIESQKLELAIQKTKIEILKLAKENK
jgi:hypothetical protein